ncbi:MULTISPECIES: PTS glucitol/sorbitol transporter subunit IIA [Enterococcus]|uniref:PTS system, glucitol/sorbitol-specific IIA component n=1 Tax=Candidatus Enterococcus ferrettii TaxID=2815324 RepID=A0ABV0ERI0_9ENTE|nr:PTS glucitol/sorbitol transporter subunit IIA [Enterococcus sp. 665A]MBO1342031.1 PTS glucitol/sorbitol transporter subunit IIA [Enterococcus sp. 665A]
MTKTEIIQIGEQAINEEPLLILFGESVTPELAIHSIVQRKEEGQSIDLNVGSEIRFGDQVYHVTALGHLANQNLNEIGHATLFFKKSENESANGIYLEPEVLPNIEAGMEISFL